VILLISFLIQKKKIQNEIIIRLYKWLVLRKILAIFLWQISHEVCHILILKQKTTIKIRRKINYGD